MEDFKLRLCRLCLATINIDNYDTNQNVTNEILSGLLFKVDFDNNSRQILCKDCLTKLYSALKFRSTCLDADKRIVLSVDDATQLPVDLKEIYFRKRESEQLSEDVNICRLCMQPINSVGFKLINEEQVDMLQKFVPEMNIFIVKEPVICKLCHESLVVHCNFLKRRWDVELNIVNSSKWQIPDAPLSVPSVDRSVKIEDVDREFEDVPEFINTECLDIDYEEIKNESEIPGEETFSEAEYKTDLESQHPDSQVLMYKCADCDYEAKYESYLKRHVLIHKDPSEVQMYKCEMCNYGAKRKEHLRNHMLIHKDPSEVQMYVCGFCNYKAKRKEHLRNHLFTHKNSSELQMYKCENCDFVTRIKGNLKRHVLIHKDPSEVQMFKCEMCNYEAKRKEHLKNHMLIHKDPLEVHMYVCGICNYKAKRKEHLKYHVLTHKNSSEVQMYKCEHCIYETKYKTTLRRHMLKEHLKEPQY